MTTATATKSKAPGIYNYRGIGIAKNDFAPSHRRWGTIGNVGTLPIRGRTLRDVTDGIDYILQQQADANDAQKRAEESARILYPALKGAQVQAKAKYLLAKQQQPKGPWHVEETPETMGRSYSVYPHHTAGTGARMPVARKIAQRHVAEMMALAPAMLTLLRWVGDEMRNNRDFAKATSLYDNVMAVVEAVERSVE